MVFPLDDVALAVSVVSQEFVAQLTAVASPDRLMVAMLTSVALQVT